VHRTVQGLAPGARYWRTVRHPGTGKALPVFTAQRGGRVCRIVTEHLGGPSFAVLAVTRPRGPASEAEVAETFEGEVDFGPLAVTLTWSGKVTLDAASKSPTTTSPGVYVLEDASGKPIYVGKAGNIRSRMAYHKSQGDVAGAAFARYATMSPAPRDDLRTAEATLIRAFKRQSGANLPKNTQNIGAFTASGGAIQITNPLPSGAPYAGYGIANPVTVAGNAAYEIAEDRRVTGDRFW
jgi:hypothetical protein